MQGKHFEDLSIGDFAEMTATVTDETIRKFAEVSGDDNPIHLDEAYAATTQFGERIAHGMLSAGFISAVLGMRLPGPGSVYLSQTLRFTKPVRIGDTVTARVEVVEVIAAKRQIGRASYRERV